MSPLFLIILNFFAINIEVLNQWCLNAAIVDSCCFVELHILANEVSPILSACVFIIESSVIISSCDPLFSYKCQIVALTNFTYKDSFYKWQFDKHKVMAISDDKQTIHHCSISEQRRMRNRERVETEPHYWCSGIIQSIFIIFVHLFCKLFIRHMQISSRFGLFE